MESFSDACVVIHGAVHVVPSAAQHVEQYVEVYVGQHVVLRVCQVRLCSFLYQGHKIIQMVPEYTDYLTELSHWMV